MPLMELYGKNAMPDVDNILTSFYQLNDTSRQEIVEMIQIKLKHGRDPQRAEDIKNIKKWLFYGITDAIFIKKLRKKISKRYHEAICDIFFYFRNVKKAPKENLGSLVNTRFVNKPSATSIPLRFISVAGCRPINKQK